MVLTAVSQNPLTEYVLRRRNELGLSQNRLAEKAGLSNAWVGRLETGTLIGRPKMETLQKLAKGLQVDVSVLMVAAGYLPGEASVFLAPERPAFETGRYPATPDERALMNEAEARGLSFDTFGVPGFWDRPEDDPDREDAFHHLRRMIQIDKRIRGA